MLWRIWIFINISIYLSCFFQVIVGRIVNANVRKNDLVAEDVSGNDIESAASMDYEKLDQKEDDEVGQSNTRANLRSNVDAKGGNTDCWMTLDAFKHHHAMDSIESQYENVRTEFKNEFNEKAFDKAMLKAMIENRAVAKRALYNALGNSSAVPAGINLGGNGVLRTKDALLFFNRMKLRNDTHFRVKFVKSDLYNMVLSAHISLNDLHLVGDYQRVHTDIDPSNLFYRPTLGTLEILLRDAEYTMEGRYILRGDKLMVEHVISNIVTKGALISYMNDQKKPTKTTPIDISNFLDTLKADLNDWLKDYFNDYLIYLPRSVDSKVQLYDKKKTLALNDYVDSALRGLKQRQRKLGLTNIKLPVFNIYTVNGIAMQLQQGYVTGLDSIYRRSVATTLQEKETRKVDAIVGFSNLKCIYKYEVVVGPGSPRLAGTLIMTANELTSHMSIMLLKEPAAADLKFNLLKQLKPEFLTIEGPANTALANYKAIVERQIVALMVNSLHFTVVKLRSLIKCDPTTDLEGVSFGEPRNEGDASDDRTTRMPDELSPPDEPYASTTPNSANRPGKHTGHSRQESAVTDHPKHSDTEPGANDYVLNKDSSIEFVVPGKGRSEEKVHVKHKESYIIRRDSKHKGQAFNPETIDQPQSKEHSPAQGHIQEIPPQPQDIDKSNPGTFDHPQSKDNYQGEITHQPQDVDGGKHTPEQEPVDINQLQPRETGADNYALNKDSSIEMVVPGKSGNKDKVHVKHKESYLISRDPNHKGQASNPETIDQAQSKEHSPAQGHIQEIPPQPQDIDKGHPAEPDLPKSADYAAAQPADINQPQPRETGAAAEDYVLNKDSSIEMVVPGKTGNQDNVHVKHKESYVISRDPNQKGQASNPTTFDHPQSKDPQPQGVDKVAGHPAEPDHPKSGNQPEQEPADINQPQPRETGAAADSYALNRDSSMELVVPDKSGKGKKVHVKHKESYFINDVDDHTSNIKYPDKPQHGEKLPVPGEAPIPNTGVTSSPLQTLSTDRPQSGDTGAVPDVYVADKESSIELLVPDISGKTKLIHVKHNENYTLDRNVKLYPLKQKETFLQITGKDATHQPHSQEIITANGSPQSKKLLSAEDNFTTDHPPFVEITTTKDSASTTPPQFDEIVTAKDFDTTYHPQSGGNISAKDAMRTNHQQSEEIINDDYVLNIVTAKDSDTTYHPQSVGNISAKDTMRTNHQQSEDILNDNYVLNRDSSIELSVPDNNGEETVHLKHSAKYLINSNTLNNDESKKNTSLQEKSNRRHDNLVDNLRGAKAILKKLNTKHVGKNLREK